MHLLNKSFNKQGHGMIPEIIQKLLRDIFQSILMISETLRCLNKSGDVLFNWLLHMKKIKPLKLLKLFVQNYVKSEHLIAQVNFWNKLISLKKLLEPIVKEETMMLPKTVQE